MICNRLYGSIPGLLLLLSIVPAVAAAQAFDRATLEAALQGNDRSIQHRMRDEQRRPLDVLEFLQLEPGMQVLDVYAGDGYYSFILARATGLRGRVYAQLSPGSTSLDRVRSEPAERDALDETIERGQLLNVERIDRPVNRMNLEEESLDFILMSQILHDHYNRSPQQAANVLTTLYRALRPGGILGVIDHSGMAGMNNERLHRMLKSQAIEVAEQTGFRLEAESDLLAVDDDSLRRSVFDPMLRQSDQFLLRFRKPAP